MLLSRPGGRTQPAGARRPAPRVRARASARPRADASTSAPAAPLPVVILPGLGNAATDYAPLAAALRLRGAPAVAIAPVTRPDWLRNAAGLVRPEYWTGRLTPLPTTAWYMDRIDSAVADALEAAAAAVGGGGQGNNKVALVAHSAGGWLARTWLLERGGASCTASLATLGSPHAPPPPGSGLPDQTRGILTWVEANCPGAFHADIAYTTVAARYLRGAPLLGGRDGGGSGAAPVTLAARLAGAGYAAVCGRADVWGDAITPVQSAHLAGARQVTLDGVFHGPLGATPDPEGVGGAAVSKEGAAPRFWYGSASVIDLWAPEALGLAPLGGRLLAASRGGGK
jgi:hypothetical protein